MSKVWSFTLLEMTFSGVFYNSETHTMCFTMSQKKCQKKKKNNLLYHIITSHKSRKVLVLLNNTDKFYVKTLHSFILQSTCLNAKPRFFAERRTFKKVQSWCLIERDCKLIQLIEIWFRWGQHKCVGTPNISSCNEGKIVELDSFCMRLIMLRLAELKMDMFAWVISHV